MSFLVETRRWLVEMISLKNDLQQTEPKAKGDVEAAARITADGAVKSAQETSRGNKRVALIGGTFLLCTTLVTVVFANWEKITGASAEQARLEGIAEQKEKSSIQSLDDTVSLHNGIKQNLDHQPINDEAKNSNKAILDENIKKINNSRAVLVEKYKVYRTQIKNKEYANSKITEGEISEIIKNLQTEINKPLSTKELLGFSFAVHFHKTEEQYRAELQREIAESRRQYYSKVGLGFLKDEIKPTKLSTKPSIRKQQLQKLQNNLSTRLLEDNDLTDKALRFELRNSIVIFKKKGK